MCLWTFLVDRTDKEGLPIRPIFISVDPDRDNVSQMRFYAQGERPATPPPLALNLGMTVLNLCIACIARLPSAYPVPDGHEGAAGQGDQGLPGLLQQGGRG